MIGLTISKVLFSQCENNEQLWHHVMYCMHCLIFKRNVFRNQRKCNTQKIPCLWCKNGIYYTREIGFLNICTHENINKFLSHLWNKFHIRQTNDDQYTQLQRNIFEFLILHFCRIYDFDMYIKRENQPKVLWICYINSACLLVGMTLF